MTWLQPIGLVALIALPLIVLLHALRPRHRTRPISSLLLWREVAVAPRASRRWRRPRLTLPLVLQLIAAALVAFAIASPAAERERGRHTAVVLDGSRVMQAQDAAPNRFEAARTQALEAIRGLGPGDAATVIVAGPSPEVIVWAADPLAALAAIGGPEAGQRARAGQGTADLATAIELASAALRSAPAATNDLLILAGSGLEGLRLNDVPARTTVKTIGSGGPNVGLVALDVRRPPGVAAARGYARIANLADTPAAVTLAIGGDGIPLERQTLRLEPRSERPLTFGVPAGVRDVEARLEPVAGTDLFPADNRSTASVGGYHRVVIFVGSSDDPVQRALGVLPGVTVRQLSPEQYQTQIASLEGGQQDAGSGSQPDVPGPSAVVFSGWLPERPPSLPALVIAPGGGSSWLTAGQSAGQARLIRQDTQSPLLRGVDLSGVSFGSVRPPDLPEWAASSAEVAEGPVIYQGSLEGRRVAVLAFDPQQSSLPKLPSFPVLLSNSLAWLAPAPDAADGVVMDPGAREREGDLRALVVPMPEAQPMALRPDRLIEAAWWQWLVAGAFLLLIAEWWRYGREAR